MSKFKVVLDPKTREKEISKLLCRIGLSHVKEDSNACYCPISLTSTPSELKPILEKRQKALMNIIQNAKIKVYDPASHPKYNPDKDQGAPPVVVFGFDSARVAEGRYFSGHKILPSDGFGAESVLAFLLNKISVGLLDKNIRVSRMMPPATIYLSYDNFDEQTEDIKQVFKMLKSYEPGQGLIGKLPVLLGFEKKSTKIVDLEDEVYNNFPHLQFKYNGKLDIVKLKVENPEIFYELRR